MDRKRSKKAKSLGAARKKIRSENPDAETHLVQRGPSEPPDRNFIRTGVEVRRFTQNAAVANQGFTLANGHDQFLVVTNVTGAAVPYVDSWRLKFIDIWLVGNVDGSSSNLALSPTGGDSSNMNNDPEQLFQMSARSPTEPVHMRIKCSAKRPLGSWHFTSTTGFASTLFQLNISTNTSANVLRATMDLTFETRKNLAGLPLGYGSMTSTTTLGTMGGRSILSGMALQGINNLG
jgi:hypothetical protein